MKEFIDKNLGMLSVLFVLLLVGGFAAIKFFRVYKNPPEGGFF